MGICNSLNDDQSLKIKPENIQKLSPILHELNSEHYSTDNNPSSQKNPNKIKNKNIMKYYNISQKVLGVGSTSTVYLATNKSGEKFAIKTIHKIKENPVKNEYFSNEINILLNINHENIIKCYEVYEDSTSYYLVFELIPTGNLFQNIISSQNKQLNETDTINYLHQILKAIFYLHDEKHIVHRDIKPENFLVQNEEIKLIDFGFATKINKGELLYDTLGTPQYAAPELLIGKGYNEKVDMWSIGVVLYNMINGHQPFNNSNGDIDYLINEILNKEIDFSGFKNSKLKKLCMKLMEKDPNLRYDCKTALNEIEEIIQNNKSNKKIIYVNSKIISENTGNDIMCYNSAVTNCSNYSHNPDYELKNIFMENLNITQIKKIYNELITFYLTKSIDQILIDKICINTDIIIKYIFDNEEIFGINDKLKNELNYFINKNKEDLNKINVNIYNFFMSIIENNKLNEKKKIWSKFRSINNNYNGYSNNINFENFYYLYIENSNHAN